VFHILGMRLFYRLQVILEYNLPQKYPGDKESHSISFLTLPPLSREVTEHELEIIGIWVG